MSIKQEEFVPPGHYYSPIPSLDEIKACEHAVFGSPPSSIEGVDLCEHEQREWLEQFRAYYDTMPYKPIEKLYTVLKSYIEKNASTDNLSEKNEIRQQAITLYNQLLQENKPKQTRYFFDNPSYGYADGIIYHCILRHIKPRRVIEIGAGYSTCLLLDTNEIYFDGKIQCTSIEPYPDDLHSLLNESDGEKITIVASKIQDVDINIFKELEAGDILFVDSSHVSKVYSDVNHILFNILPVLNKGVYIHFHDIFWPFEYPKDWIYEGRFWNEMYILRAFLAYNNTFSIRFFTSYIQSVFRTDVDTAMPLLMRGDGGSLWLQKN